MSLGRCLHFIIRSITLAPLPRGCMWILPSVLLRPSINVCGRTGDASVPDKIEATVSVTSALASHEGRYKCNGLHENYHYLHIADEAEPPPTTATSAAFDDVSRSSSSSRGNSSSLGMIAASNKGRRVTIRDVSTTMETKSGDAEQQPARRGDDSDGEDLIDLYYEYYEEAAEDVAPTSYYVDGKEGSQGRGSGQTNGLKHEVQSVGDTTTTEAATITWSEHAEAATSATEVSAIITDMEMSGNDGNRRFPGPSSTAATASVEVPSAESEIIDWQRNVTITTAASTVVVVVVVPPADGKGKALTAAEAAVSRVVGNGDNTGEAKEGDSLEQDDQIKTGGVVRTARVDLEEDANGNISAKKVLTWSWTGPRDSSHGHKVVHDDALATNLAINNINNNNSNARQVAVAIENDNRQRVGGGGGGVVGVVGGIREAVFVGENLIFSICNIFHFVDFISFDFITFYV